MQDLRELERALALQSEAARLRLGYIEAARMRQERLRVASEMAVLGEAVSAVEVLREMLPEQKLISPELLLPPRREPARMQVEFGARAEQEDKEQHPSE